MIYKEYEIGKDTERRIIKLLIEFERRKNPDKEVKVVYSTKEQDMHEHWDVEINGIKYDIKGIKKENRGDIRNNENFHYIEFLNVLGNSGSLYGLCDFFVFEIENYCLVVEKIKLQEFMELKCGDKPVGLLKDPYCPYQRPNRKDKIAKAKTLDLMFLASDIIKKEND